MNAHLKYANSALFAERDAIRHPIFDGIAGNDSGPWTKKTIEVNPFNRLVSDKPAKFETSHKSYVEFLRTSPRVRGKGAAIGPRRDREVKSFLVPDEFASRF